VRKELRVVSVQGYAEGDLARALRRSSNGRGRSGHVSGLPESSARWRWAEPCWGTLRLRQCRRRPAPLQVS